MPAAPKAKLFKRILIANRGEIACRVIETAQSMGIECVAVYSDADINAKHRMMADASVHIGAAQPSASYLRGDMIVQAALDTGAEAIHPGYGFLSENPEFVETVEAAGLTFVGPSAQAIRAMGLKDAAKALMEQAGVPVVPASEVLPDPTEPGAMDRICEMAEAVGEVAEDIFDFIADKEIYHEYQILRRLVEPDRVVSFRVCWEDDNNN